MINLQELLQQAQQKQPIINGVSNNRADYGGPSSASFQAQPDAAPPPTLGGTAPDLSTILTPPGQLPGQGAPVEMPMEISAAQGQPPVPQAEPVDNRPSGMFGMKGTIRDIIGTLGDALLVGGGGQAVYAPQKREEKLGMAMQGFNEDPEAAIARMQAQGFGKEAAEAREALERKKFEEAKLAVMERKDNREAREATDKEQQAALNLAGRIGMAMDENNWPAMRKWYEQFFVSRKMQPPIDLPEEYSEEARQDIIEMGMGAEKQAELEIATKKAEDLAAYRNRYLGIQEKTADSLKETREATVADKAVGREIQREAEAGRNSRAANAAPKKGQRRTETSPSTGATRITEWTGTRWKPVAE